MTIAGLNDSPPRRKRILHRWDGLVLVLCCTLILLQRVHTYHEPLENDIAGYAVIGHEMMHGRSLYSDLWERKPPLLYATFAAAECLAGYGRAEIFLVNVTAALVTLLGIYVAGRCAPLGRGGGLIAAILWTLLCGDLFMQANQPNAEVLINTWMILAFALLLRWPKQRRRWSPAVLLGLLFAAATFNKHHMIITCGMLAIGHVVAGIRSKIRRRSAEMAVSFSVVLMLWALVLGFFAATGRWGVTTDVLFHQNAVYAGDLMHNLLTSLAPAQIIRPFLSWMICPLAIIVVFLISMIRRRAWPMVFSPQWKLWMAWAIGVWPAVVLPGHLFPHYYQLWMPVWCVAAGWAGAGILDAKFEVPNVVSWGIIGASLTVLACRELTPYCLTPDEWAEQKYRGGNYVQQEYLGQYLGETLLKPDERFWVLGDDISLYFAARRSPPSGLLYVDPLIDGNETKFYNQRLVADLERTRPALVIVSPLAERLPADAPVFGWIKKNYLPWPTALGHPKYLIFVLKDSPLQQRIFSGLETPH